MPFARYAACGIGPFVGCPGAAAELRGARTAMAVITIRNPSASTTTGTAMNAGTLWPIREVRYSRSLIAFIRFLGRSGVPRYHPPPMLPAGLWGVGALTEAQSPRRKHLHRARRHGLAGPSGYTRLLYLKRGGIPSAGRTRGRSRAGALDRRTPAGRAGAGTGRRRRTPGHWCGAG